MCLYLLLRLLTDPVLLCLQFPVGRTRLETVAVIVCAVIMSIATVLVIRESIGALVDGLAHRESSFFCAASHALTILHVGSCTQSCSAATLLQGRDDVVLSGRFFCCSMLTACLQQA